MHRFSTAIIIRIAFGHQIISDDDLYVKIADDVSYALSNAGSPGGTLVDFFPFRTYIYSSWCGISRLIFTFSLVRHLPSWFPGMYYAGFARDNKPAVELLCNYPFEEVSHQMVLAFSSVNASLFNGISRLKARQDHHFSLCS